MRFGPVPSSDAEGALLGHAVVAAGRRLPKGHRVTKADIESLQAAGLSDVIVARLEPGDLVEDEAASLIAKALAAGELDFTPAATGRINIHARTAGLFLANKDVVDRFNRIDPAITLACLADHASVAAGDMVATIKIIPLAVAGSRVDQALDVVRAEVSFAIRPYRRLDIGLVATELPTLKASVMDKTRRTLEARLVPSGSWLRTELRRPHEAGAVAEAIAQMAGDHDLIVVFGASAVTDHDDVVPAAIRLAGGSVEQVGMPVDPGNLLVLGHLGNVTIIGAPGCARSPKENGFDWILNRCLAGRLPTAHDITGMGVGGLLMEIATRPQPRDLATLAPATLTVGIVILAAGRASRMGPEGRHKLLAEFDGAPLIRISAKVATAAACGPVVVVTGHRGQEILAALDGLDIASTHNPDFMSGMASSLVAGLKAFDPPPDGVLVLLADMPGIAADDIGRLVDAFRAEKGLAVVRAVAGGQRGNPVILPRATYPDVLKLSGDVGARHIVETCGLAVIDIEIGDAARLDLDTPDAILAAGGILKA